MGITRVGRWYYWVKWVPKRYAGVVLGADGKPVQQVRQALHTDSEAEARAKAAQVEAARIAEWEATLAGDTQSAAQHYQAARDLAEARGFSYVPVQRLAEADLGEIVARLLHLKEGGALAGPAAVEAVLGGVAEVLPDIVEVRDEYFRLTRTRHRQKSEAQTKRWQQQRIRAVNNFVQVIGKKDATGVPQPMPVSEISRDDAIRFRDWWADKVAEGRQIATANKDIYQLSEMFRTWAKLKRLDFEDPFAGLRLEGKDTPEQRPPFSPAWVRTRLLAPGALDGLNDEAREIFLIMINTALRPHEITDAPLADLVLDDAIPHIAVAPHGRELKVAHTRREIPLLGVSLDAARRIASRGGVRIYAHKASTWSATVNKYLANNGLRESPKHVAYSLRHYCEDALLAAGIDDRVRADILGHKYARPRYGAGGALVGRRDALAKIAL